MHGYEPLLAPLLAMVKPGGYVVISSLFTDALVGAKIELTQHADRFFKTADREIFYDVYCLERFRSVVKGLGATSICVEDFAIDCDLPKPTHCHMGTYTEKFVDRRRLQVSGPLSMPWKFIITGCLIAYALIPSVIYYQRRFPWMIRFTALVE